MNSTLELIKIKGNKKRCKEMQEGRKEGEGEGRGGEEGGGGKEAIKDTFIREYKLELIYKSILMAYWLYDRY